MMKYINYEVRDQIAFITINRPEVRNAMDTDCWLKFITLVENADNDTDVRIIIITGAGDKVFMSGADIKNLQVRTGVENLTSISQKARQKVDECRKPVIAAINGVAFGGGFELTLVCDIRIASPNAKFGLPEAGLGIMPGGGGTQRLSRMIGIGRAKEVILAGRVLNAQEAEAAGLLMKVVEPDSLLEEAVSIAKKMIAKGPVSLNVAKKVINASLDIDRTSGLLLENLGFSLLLETNDKLEGTTAFLEKRPPQFKGN